MTVQSDNPEAIRVHVVEELPTTGNPIDTEVGRQERLLALIDRVIGLEAEVAEANVRYEVVRGDSEVRAALHLARLEDAKLRQELVATNQALHLARLEDARLRLELRQVLDSQTWRIGVAVERRVAPLRRLARLTRRPETAK